MLGRDLVLLSQADTKHDSSGALVGLYEGMSVHVYMDDVDEAGMPDNLIADGVVVSNPGEGWCKAAIWCCRIDARGVRHESDEQP